MRPLGREAYFDSTTFGGRAAFGRATFSKEAYFGRATFSEEADFGRAIFDERAFFEGATFGGEAAFEGATFGGEAAFSRARFAKLAFFKDAHFFGRLTLERALFETYADFRDTLINHLAFNNATSPQIINSRMDFRRATITEAHLQDIVFGKDINFSDTRFGVAVDAKRADQQGSYTVGPGAPRAGPTKCPQVAPDVATVFRFVTFEGHAYFLRAGFAAGRAWNASSFTKTQTLPMQSFKTIRIQAGQASPCPM